MIDESMIKEDGKLQIIVPSDKVTWFDFLKLSRATNSNFGGWDSKTHWKERGLDVISDNLEIVKKWTENSLTVTEPSIRKKNFRLDRNFNLNRAKRKPQSENRLNTLLFNKYQQKNNNDIKYISYEVPLVSESKGQLKVDLFGIKNNSFFITELKKGDNKSDSPLIALTEAICYGLQLIRILKDDDNQNFITEFNNNLDNQIILSIAAPSKYWENWKVDSDIIESFQIINTNINKVLKKLKGNDNYSFQIEFYDIIGNIILEIRK